MSEDLILGIDTSAYTTSLALLSASGKLLYDARRVLNVPQGGRGLRQAEAVYQHVRNFPDICEESLHAIQEISLSRVCVSTAPRPVDGSYMPVFVAGLSMARSVAAFAKTTIWEASHQEGHFWAALWSLSPEATADLLHESQCLAVHISGGTTECLFVDGLNTEHKDRPRLRMLAATGDISAGQFIDRVGTALGLPFPSGPHLERLAEQGNPDAIHLPIAVHVSNLSFSGPETAAQRAIAAGISPVDIAAATFKCVSISLERWLASQVRTTALRHVVVGGGVASSTILRSYLTTSKLLHDAAIWFAEPRYSSDNAVGLAAWGAARMAQVPILALPER